MVLDFPSFFDEFFLHYSRFKIFLFDFFLDKLLCLFCLELLILKVLSESLLLDNLEVSLELHLSRNLCIIHDVPYVVLVASLHLDYFRLDFLAELNVVAPHILQLTVLKRSVDQFFDIFLGVHFLVLRFGD